MGRFEILNGGFAEDISLMLTAGIYDKYYPDISKHLSYKHPINKQFAAHHLSILSQTALPLEKVAPNVDELYVIFKTAVEQCNFIGAFTMNVIFLQLSLHMLRTISKIKKSSK